MKDFSFHCCRLRLATAAKPETLIQYFFKFLQKITSRRCLSELKKSTPEPLDFFWISNSHSVGLDKIFILDFLAYNSKTLAERIGFDTNSCIPDFFLWWLTIMIFV